MAEGLPNEQVGKSNVTVEGLTVEAGKVEEFARAVGDDNPAHRDPEVARERRFSAVPAPLTFTRTSYFDRYRPAGIDVSLGFDLGFEPEYVVHGEQGYEYERPVVAGDTLTGTTTLTDVYEREGSRGGTLRFAELETAYRDVDDELVLTEYNTRIETAGSIDDQGAATDDSDAGGEGESRMDGSGAGDERDAETDASRSDGRPATDDARTPLDPRAVAVGDAGPTVVSEDLDREDFVRYAGASGDFNSIHYSEPYATAAGNPSVFGQGMLTAGIAAHLVADWLGLANVRRFRTRFEARLWPGTTVSATGEVTDVRSGEDETLVDVAFAVTNEGGTDLVTGDATGTFSK